MHSYWSLIPGGTTLFNVELESPLVAAPDLGSSWEILGSGLFCQDIGSGQTCRPLCTSAGSVFSFALLFWSKTFSWG